MDIKEVLEYNVKVMRDHLNIENLSGNVAKQEFYKGAIYALSGLLAHPVLSESPATPSNTPCAPCNLCGSPMIQQSYDVCTNENCPGYEP